MFTIKQTFPRSTLSLRGKEAGVCSGEVTFQCVHSAILTFVATLFHSYFANQYFISLHKVLKLHKYFDNWSCWF